MFKKLKSIFKKNKNKKISCKNIAKSKWTNKHEFENKQI